MIYAGRLRHRVTIERRADVQNPDNGEMVPQWQVVADDVPASIEPLSVREFIAANAEQTKISARIVMRFRSQIDHTMRIVHKDMIYNIHGVLRDKNSGLEYVTCPVSEGINHG